MNKSLRAQVALAELEAMGLTVDDLVVAAGRDRSAPPPKRTVAEYLPVVAAGYKPRTRRTYNSYWILMVELIGDRPLDQVTVEDVLAVADEAERRAKQRRVGSDGRASSESCVAAARAVFTRALKAGHVAANPALLVEKPRRLPNRRRALTNAELDDVWAAVTATTRDPELERCPQLLGGHRTTIPMPGPDRSPGRVTGEHDPRPPRPAHRLGRGASPKRDLLDIARQHRPLIVRSLRHSVQRCVGHGV